MKLKVAVILSCVIILSVILTIVATYTCISNGVEHLNMDEYGEIIFTGNCVCGNYPHVNNIPLFEDIINESN